MGLNLKLSWNLAGNPGNAMAGTALYNNCAVHSVALALQVLKPC